MPWRSQKEIDKDRQNFLAERRAIKPDVATGLYPFQGVTLDCADIEWLLATHESNRVHGPVDWDDGVQRKRIGIDVRGAILNDVDLGGLPLARTCGGMTGIDYDNATAKQRDMARVHMPDVRLRYARLEGSIFTHANMENADLVSAHLEGADLFGVSLNGKNVVNLTDCVMSADTRLGVRTDAGSFCNRDGVAPRLHGVVWNGASLAQVNWRQVRMLGDEWVARQPVDADGNKKSWDRRTEDYATATRANRQLAVVLREQGLHDGANEFAYRAQLLQRVVYRRQRKLPSYIGSLLLDLIAGYGYRPMRSLYMYVATIGVFAFLFWCVTNDVSLTFGWFTNVITGMGMSPPPPSPQHLQGYEAVVMSMTCFHGRGFFEPVQSPGDKVAIIAALEAFVGLFLEIILIATFTRRFFAGELARTAPLVQRRGDDGGIPTDSRQFQADFPEGSTALFSMAMCHLG
jgi:Pentapeptide repeats (8 copies)